MKYSWILYFMVMMVWSGCVSAQEKRDSVSVHFRQGYSILDTSFRGNGQSLHRLIDSIRASQTKSTYRLSKIQIVGAASPEGTIPLNNRLSQKRANVLFNYISRYVDLPDTMRAVTPVGRDWGGLIRMVEADPAVPYKEEALEVLKNIHDEVSHGKATFPHMGTISRLQGGKPYKYMYDNLFPDLRASKLYLWYDNIGIPSTVGGTSIAMMDYVLPPLDLTIRPVETQPSLPPFYMSIRNNLLYDALLIPNVGVDVYLGKNWSLSGFWHYAWWDIDPSHIWWRTYGGDVEIRKWFGKKAKEKPLTGHHIGPYGQIVTYDFELGGRGYLGDKWSYAVGVAYGYSKPIGRRLNLDFTIGVGYLWGEYKEYIPIDNCYVWQATKQRNWVGPTKAEISLVWLIGRGNENRDKGGRR